MSYYMPPPTLPGGRRVRSPRSLSNGGSFEVLLVVSGDQIASKACPSVIASFFRDSFLAPFV